MAQTARVTLTLSNIATEEDLNNMEERIMSALSDAIASLKTTVANLQVAQSPEKVQELEAALQAERDAYAAFAQTEAAEDVEQNRQLDEAKAATDALVAEMTGAAGQLNTITAQLSAVGAAVEETPDETPVGDVAVEAPAPDVEPPAQAPVEGEATPTPDPSNSATTDEGVSLVGGAPAEASVPSSAPATGPVDASGNAVEGPRL